MQLFARLTKTYYSGVSIYCVSENVTTKDQILNHKFEDEKEAERFLEKMKDFLKK